MQAAGDSPGLHPYAGDDVRRLERLGEAYEQNQLWGDQSGEISYRINRLGFRGPELVTTHAPCAFVFGESHAFGLGLPLESCWPQHVFAEWSRRHGQRAQDAALVNFAEPGASNAYITRLLLTQSHRHRPDLVMLHFSELERAEGVVAGQTIRMGPWLTEEFAEQTVRNAPEKYRDLVAEWRHAGCGYARYRSDEDDAASSLRSILLAQFFCRGRGIPAIATCDGWRALQAWSKSEALRPLVDWIDPAFLVPRRLADVADRDEAADRTHHGPGAHAEFARHLLAELSGRTVEAAKAVRPCRLQTRVLVVGDAVHTGWAESFAARWADANGLDPTQVEIREHSVASNAELARVVLTESAARQPDLVLAAFADPLRHEVQHDGRPRTLAPTGGHGGMWSRLQPRTALQRRAEEFRKFANDEVCALDSLRSILLMQFFCAANGIAVAAVKGAAHELWSPARRWSAPVRGLLELVDDPLVLDRRGSSGHPAVEDLERLAPEAFARQPRS